MKILKIGQNNLYEKRNFVISLTVDLIKRLLVNYNNLNLFKDLVRSSKIVIFYYYPH